MFFEKDCVPPDDAMHGHIDDINASILKVRSLLSDEIKIDDGATPFALYGDVQCYLQVHLRRALMFLDGGKSAILSSHGLVSVTCARALYESAACIHDFRNVVCEHLAINDLEGAAKFVFERTLAMRYSVNSINDDKLNFTAVNVLKQIDKLEKVVPQARRSYEQLSETVHPNAFGAYLYFGTTRANGVARFKRDAEPEMLNSLLLSSASLFSLIYNDVLDVMLVFVKRFERDLSDRIEDYERRKAAGLVAE